MKSSGRIGPGASTILMILVVLVMTMLGVLSLFSARNDMEMSERTSAPRRNTMPHKQTLVSGCKKQTKF